MKIKKTALVLVCILLAALSNLYISEIIGYALEAQEVRDYQPGKPVFTKPHSEGYAKEIKREIEEKLQRDDILRRYAYHHNYMMVLLMETVGALIDPSGIIIFSILLFLYFKFAKKLLTTKAP